MKTTRISLKQLLLLLLISGGLMPAMVSAQDTAGSETQATSGDSGQTAQSDEEKKPQAEEEEPECE